MPKEKNYFKFMSLISISKRIEKYEERIKNKEELTAKEQKQYRDFLRYAEVQKTKKYSRKLFLIIMPTILLIVFSSLKENYTLYLGLFYLFSILAILIYIWSKKGKLKGRKKILYYFYPFYFTYALNLKIFLKLGLVIYISYAIVTIICYYKILRKKIEEDV